jgi:hypothetical protein
MTFTLMAFFLMTGFSSEVSAKAVKKKAKTSTSYVSNSKKKKSKNNRVAKTRRYRRSGTGPDLRTLTTEKPNTEYIENPDNGVNAVETKSEL